MARKNFNTTIDEGTLETITRLAVNGRSKGEVIDLSVAMFDEDRPKYDMGDVVTRLDGLRDALYVVSDMATETVEAVREKRRIPTVHGTLPAMPPVPEGFDPASIPGVSQGSKVEVENAKPKTNKCGHCGRMFAGPKGSTLCQPCIEGGHWLDMRDCAKCGEYGTGAL